jgi:transcriptional regulator with XRE-family HTH domain
MPSPGAIKSRRAAAGGTRAKPDTRRGRQGIALAVGRALRALRNLRDLTARDLAARARVSAAMVSRIEKGQVAPSLATLGQLAAALQVPLASLLSEAASPVADLSHVPAGGGLKSFRTVGRYAHEFTVLGFLRRPDLQFEGHQVVVKRSQGAPPPTYTGNGSVFIYVLEGEAIYRYGAQRIHLRTGDSLCFSAETRYGLQEVITPKFRFLSVQAERR